MYTHILVPLDGSELAEQVLPHVTALALRFRARLTLLRATTAAQAVGMQAALAGALPGGGPIADATPLIAAEREAAATYLAAVAERLRERGLTVAVEQHDGAPAELILTRARARGADLIAMTTHGRGGLGRLLLGSVADAVVRHASVPVLLVRAQETAAPSPAATS